MSSKPFAAVSIGSDGTLMTAGTNEMLEIHHARVNLSQSPWRDSITDGFAHILLPGSYYCAFHLTHVRDMVNHG